jgi:hypothetical protein
MARRQSSHGRRVSGTRSSEIASANAWRRTKIDALVAAHTADDWDAVLKARLPLVIATDTPAKTGFQRTDIEHFVGIMTKRLDGGFVRQDGSTSRGIRSALSGKTHALGKANERIARLAGRVKHDVIKDRDRVAREAKDVGHKVRALEATIESLRVVLAARRQPRAALQAIGVPAEKTEEVTQCGS